MKLTVQGNYAIVERGCIQWCFSYGVCIARMYKAHGHTSATGLVLSAQYHDYSATTRKHRARFTGLTAKEIRAKIETGEICVENLQ